MRVYIGQYGDVWSLSAKEWMELCEKAAETGAYDLTPYKMLKKRPQCLIRWSDEDGSEFSAADDRTIYREPLDWWQEDFAIEGKEFPIELERVKALSQR
jgi:hypothetical protein